MEEKKEHKILKKLLKIVIIFILIITLIIIYSYFIGNSGLKVKEYKIVNKKIPTEFNGLKIVHISDIHYGKYFNEKKLEKVVNKINEINPDIVVFTGDLVDKELSNEERENLTKLLSQINASIGKYAISGNHDYKYKEWKSIIKNSNFINLNDTFDIIYSKESQIMISGISTNFYKENDVNKKLESSNKYLDENEVNYKILLIHEPDFIDNIKSNSYDLILSGHSHTGQVRIPLISSLWMPSGSKKYNKDYYKLNSSDLYISSGLGTSIMPLRLFNKPSFNFYRLTQK